MKTPLIYFEHLGKHSQCGGSVNLVHESLSGSRLCMKCGEMGVMCQLETENKDDDVTVVSERW